MEESGRAASLRWAAYTYAPGCHSNRAPTLKLLSLALWQLLSLDCRYLSYLMCRHQSRLDTVWEKSPLYIGRALAKKTTCSAWCAHAATQWLRPAILTAPWHPFVPAILRCLRD